MIFEEMSLKLSSVVAVIGMIISWLISLGLVFFNLRDRVNRQEDRLENVTMRLRRGEERFDAIERALSEQGTRVAVVETVVCEINKKSDQILDNLSSGKG